MGVEVVFGWVIVGWSGNDNEISLAVRRAPVKSGSQVKGLLGKILFYVFVLNGRLAPVDFLNLFRHHVNRRDMVVLRQQRGYAHANIARSCNCYIHICLEICYEIVCSIREPFSF